MKNPAEIKVGDIVSLHNLCLWRETPECKGSAEWGDYEIMFFALNDNHPAYVADNGIKIVIRREVSHPRLDNQTEAEENRLAG